MTTETTQSSLLSKISAYTEMLEKDPQSTIFVSLSESYRKMGRLDDARKIVEAGLASHPDLSPGHIVLARILCQQEDYASSEASFALALQLDGNSLAGLVGYARLSVLIGEIEKARNLLLTARSLSPADPVINKFLNSLPAAENEADEGSCEAKEVSAPLITETLAVLYLKQGLPEKALEILRELLRHDPADLKLRRRIREAELILQGEGELIGAESQPVEIPDNDLLATSADLTSDSEAEAPPYRLETPDTEVEVTAVSQMSDLDQVEPSSFEAEVMSRLTPLQMLNQWLENIQKRRNNVQADIGRYRS